MIGNFGVANSLVLILYLLAMLVVGLLFSFAQKTREDYFLAARGMPWLPVAMSMFASVTSAITFMGVPSRAYSENVSLMVVCLVSPLLAPLLARFFFPAYRRAGVTTSYEFIGLRFGQSARLTVSVLFLLARLGWMATVIYAPALAFHIATGISLEISILCMGVVATAYTVMGGLKAVLWTDVVQFVVLVGGAIWVAVSLTADAPGGVSEILAVARESGRLNVVEGGWDIGRMSVFAVAVSFFLMLMQDYGTDQVTVQRLLAVRDDRGVFKAVSFNAVTDFFMIGLLSFIGLGLWRYYQLNPGDLAGAEGDQVLPHYIVTHLPAGVSGLVISAIFAAAMSSMDSGINSMATVIENDLLSRVRGRDVGEKEAVHLARVLTLLLGAVATALALIARGVDHIVAQYATAIGLFSAPVLSLFVLGMVSRSARFGGWLAGVVLSIPCTLFAKHVAHVNWVYYFPLSFSVTYVVGWTAGVVFPASATGEKGPVTETH